MFNNYITTKKFITSSTPVALLAILVAITYYICTIASWTFHNLLILLVFPNTSKAVAHPKIRTATIFDQLSSMLNLIIYGFIPNNLSAQLTSVYVIGLRKYSGTEYGS